MSKDFIIRDNSPEVMRKIKGLTAKGIVEFVESAEERTKQLAPVRKVRGGNHRSSIGHKIFNSLRNKAILFSASNYGAYLEFGTRKMAARPHFRPAINQTIKKFDNDKLWKM